MLAEYQFLIDQADHSVVAVGYALIALLLSCSVVLLRECSHGVFPENYVFSVHMAQSKIYRLNCSETLRSRALYSG